MAIQISGTTVVDNSRNITNLESIAGNGVATQAEAEAGTVNDQFMTPLRVSQAISALSGGSGVDGDINWSTCNVGCSVRGGGNVVYKQSNIIWIVGPSTTEEFLTWPIGYCNGSNSETVNQAQRITGRSGWFIPDIGMLKVAYNCRAYWDTYGTYRYWSSTEFDASRGCEHVFSSNFSDCSQKQCTTFGVRPFRVICY
jgi:hypothetical protein